MRFVLKLRNILLALLPVMAIVLFVHFFLYSFDSKLLTKFFVSAVLIIFGEALFLTGVDSTIIPMGELMVGSVNKMSKFVIFVFFSVLFGFFATIAEPDVSVFTTQLGQLGFYANRIVVLFCIGAGVGLFVAFSLFTLIKMISLKYIYVVLFALIFLLASQVNGEYLALAFDAGGATTGMISVPFLLAIATGISAKFSKDKKSREIFGIVGITSLGPVISVLILLLVAQRSGTIVVEEQLSLVLEVFKNAIFAVLPLAIIFLIYDLIFIKLPTRKKLKFSMGLIIVFAGLFLFIFGIEYGFTPIGYEMGRFLSSQSNLVIIIFCIAFGFIMTFAEPSVIVLAKQVNEATNGSIPYFVVMIGIAISMALAILLAALRIIFNINFVYIILTGYFVALVLMFVVDGIFTGIAFDSGGVASGPMTSAFILPLMLSLAASKTGSLSGFGIIGIVAMTPIVIIQLFGLAYKVNMAVSSRKEHKRAISISYTSDAYSNIEKLEAEYKKLKGRIE